MRVALVAHPRHPIRPPFAGGMEAHCWHLARALIARGHDVTLFAAGDSDPCLPVVPIVPVHLDRDYPQDGPAAMERLNARTDAAHAQLARRLLDGGFDVVHNNGLHRFLPRLAKGRGLPMVTSLHVPPFDALIRSVRSSAAPWARFTAPSAAQRRSWWPDGAPREAEVVHNGIDLTAWPYRRDGDGTAAWSGRIAPNKGAHLAVRAARAAGMPLTLYGRIEDRAYFDAEIAPHLGAGIRHAGHLSGTALADSLGRASVFLFTPLWDEPFGLAAVEAMACGLPVASLDMGAAREVIGPEAGRFVPPDAGPASLARALREAASLPRPAARARAERFSQERMLAAYEAIHARAIAARPVEPQPIRYPPIELTIAPRAERMGAR